MTELFSNFAGYLRDVFIIKFDGWVVLGFVAQGFFTMRFLVQWIASEKKKDSVVPVAFWWLSLVGGMTLLSYAIHKRDPVIIVGQGMGLVVYVRNLMLVGRARQRAARRQKAQPESASSSKPHRIDPASRKVPFA